MSKTLATLSAIGLAALFGVGVAGAKPAMHQARGKISRIDTGARTLVVDENGTPHTYALAKDAKIMAGAKTRGLAELQVGEQVTVSFEPEGSKNVAQRVEVARNTSKATQPMAKPGTPPAKP